MDLKQYIDELNRQFKTGLAREHSYRPALKDLLQSLLPNMVVTNEPAHFAYLLSSLRDFAAHRNPEGVTRSPF